MIKNERQYRITKAQADKFDQALSELRSASTQPTDVHPLLMKAQEDALRSQLEDLQAQLEEYDALRSGQRKVLEVASFADLPRALIQARIAAGISQKQLAERLGLKEQQIQQYEATEYASASLSRVQEVIDALEVLVREDVFLPSAQVTKRTLFQRLQSVGVDRGLILKRILPKPLAATLEADTSGEARTLGHVVLQAASLIGRVFDLKLSAIFSDAPLRLNMNALQNARFKVATNVDERRWSAYTIYAHYLALLALDASEHVEQQPVPDDPEAVRAAIVTNYGSVTFENALRYIWSLGIPVLPLADSASFHGACWRVKGRNVIVLAQQTRFPARWLNDGLHELGHAGQEPEQSERAVIETDDILRGHRDSEEEKEAHFFAEDIIFDGRAEEIAHKCAQRAGNIPRLRAVVPRVAAEEGVPADSLAYYIAYSLSLDGEDWWGTATNLQDRSSDPWTFARDMFLENADLSALNDTDRALLLQALSERET